MAASASAQLTSDVQQHTDQDGGKAPAGEGNKVQTSGGKCGYRELRSGIECGCQTFWGKSSKSHEVSVCACGHHACYHSPNGNDSSAVGSVERGGTADLSASLMAQLNQLGRILATVTPVPDTLSTPIGRTITEYALAQYPTSNSRLPEITSTEVGPPVIEDKPDQITQSSVSTSYQPRVPSVCLIAEPAASSEVLQPWRPNTRPSSTGLGVWLQDVATASGNHVQRDQATDDTDFLQGMLPIFNLPSTISSTDLIPTAPQSAEAQTSANIRAQLLPALDVSSYRDYPGFEDLLQSATEINTPSVGTRTPDINIPPAVIRPSTENRDHLTLHNRASPRNMPPPRTMPRTSIGTPSLSGTKRVMTPSSQVISPPVMLREPQNLREVAGQLQAMRRFMTDYVAQLRGLGDRMDLVERTSTFSQIPREQDIIDKLDLIETRIMDVEAKIEDVRANAEIDSSRSTFINKRHNELRENESGISNQSSQSIGSDNSSVIALNNGRNAVKIRMDGLDERVTDLEKSMPPSLSRPLEVEVVLIPWGRDLRGLWVAPGEVFNSRGVSRFTTQDTEDWTSLPSSSRVSASLRSGRESGWTSEAIHDWADDADEWLIPRACSTKSVVYCRLKSRGFVKSLEISKPGAKELQEAISKAFGETLVQLNTTSQHEEDQAGNGPKSTFLGLAAPFVPLRKVHRSSHLRFLAKSEMITPALWTTEFLSSSAMMHAAGGLKRLFITHKEAYLQAADSDTPLWTWQRLRELPRTGSQTIEEGDARETCWADHPVLDAQPISVNTSFESHMSSLSHRSKLTQQSASHGVMQDGVLTEVDDEADIKSESQSGFESEALPTAEKPFAPITPVTEQDIGYPIQDGMDNLLDMSGANWYGSHSDGEAEPPSTPHPVHLQTPYLNMSGPQQRYNFRQHTRTLSNPLAGVSSSGNPSARSTRYTQPAKPKRVTRSFSTPSNPLIATLPSFVPSSPRTRSSRRRGTNEPTSSGNKRRRIDRSISAEEMASYRAFQHRSRSVSATVLAAATATKGKRSMTPVGPYMTPYSGNFGDGNFGYGNRGSEGRVESDGEVWEGLEEHVARLSEGELQDTNVDVDDAREEDFLDNDDDDDDDDVDDGFTDELD